MARLFGKARGRVFASGGKIRQRLSRRARSGNTLVVHTFDSFACCETAASGIPTAICREVEIDRAVRPDCYRLADQLTAAGYAADFADFDGETEPRDLKLKVLPSVNSLLAKKIIDRLSEA